jgi:hypothetical protein
MAIRMRLGAFALIDALGFKGIWDMPGGAHVIGKMKSMAKTVTKNVSFANKMLNVPMASKRFGPARATFLSDSIAMAVFVGDDSDTQSTIGQLRAPAAAVVSLALHVSAARKEAALTDPPLAYRGCVSFGRCRVESRFIIGPAVDQSAESAGLAEGAFVWLDPAAKAVLERDTAWDAARSEWQNLRLSGVPLKGGSEYQTYVVCPYGPGEPSASKKRIYTRIVSSFDPSRIEVAVKQQNTAAFLGSYYHASQRAVARMARRGTRGSPPDAM